MYLLSLRARKKGQRSQGLMWSALGLGLITAGAYLGGHLVFGKKVGVNHSEALTKPENWTTIIAAADLPERQAQSAEIEGQAALLYREGNQVSAVSAVCSHQAGPLQEGTFAGNTVQCPWHDSVFDLRDGQVIHGPATYPLPCFEARVRDGQVEVRVPEA
jgi:nitrite reductase/ring-hydroxylating ferredoxin subunit